MDISVSKAKNTLKKACQVLAKESTSKSLNLELQIWEPKCQNLLRERGKKMKGNWRKGSNGETAARSLYCLSEVIDPKFVQTEAYIGA